MLRCDQLHIGYDSLLFEVASFILKRGELTALIGPNGAGKTTFLETLQGNLDPLKGEIYNSNGIISAALRKKLITNVPSKFFGVAHLSVYDYIALGRAPFTNFLHRLNDSDKAVIESVIQQLELEEIQHLATDKISDGQRQIASIAMALVQESEVLLLDEPTAFLDYSNRRKILQILNDLAVNKDVAILLSSHDIELCLDFSHRIVAVNANEKQLISYPKNVTKKEIIKQIFPED